MIYRIDLYTPFGANNDQSFLFETHGKNVEQVREMVELAYPEFDRIDVKRIDGWN